MGCLNSKKGEGEGGLMDTLKAQAFNMVLQTNGSGEGDSKFDFAKGLISKAYPKANITRETDDSAPDSTFNALFDGKNIFSEDSDGDVRESPNSFIAAIKSALLTKIGM